MGDDLGGKAVAFDVSERRSSHACPQSIQCKQAVNSMPPFKYVATLAVENLELLEENASNSDNIDYGEMIHVYGGADVRSWEGDVRQFLLNEQCEQKKIERIVADEPKS